MKYFGCGKCPIWLSTRITSQWVRIVSAKYLHWQLYQYITNKSNQNRMAQCRLWWYYFMRRLIRIYTVWKRFVLVYRTETVKKGKTKKVREKSRECHNHKPQPIPDPKRKRKPTNLNKHKPNKRTKSTTISSLFPKQGNRNIKGLKNTRTKWHMERHTTNRLVE